MTKKPKVLIWDIETLPNVVASFGVWNQNIGKHQLIKETSMICAAWKWMGEKKIHTAAITDYDSFKENVFDDKQLVADIAKVVAEADVLIHHNGDKFDKKYLNSRLVYHGLDPLPRQLAVDTYKACKANFNFTYNSLAYVAKKLGVEQKGDISMPVWLDIIQGKRSAVKKMLKYNKQDVVVLEEVYNKLRPFIHNHPNMNLLTDSEGHNCPNCGGSDLQKRGFVMTKTSKKQRYRCNDCGAWSASKTSLMISDMRGQ